MLSRRSLALAAPLAGVLVASAMAGSASADTTQTLGCRASVARVNVLSGGLVVEPFVANPNGSPCASDGAGLTTGQLLNVGGLGSLLGGAIQVGPASASTTSTSSDSSRGARSLVTVNAVSIPTPGGAVSLVGPASTSASYECVNGAAQATASSTLSALQVGSTRVALAGPGQPDTIPLYGQLNLLGQRPVIGYVSVNQTTTTATGATEDLLDVHVNNLADVVVGEAAVSQPASGACSGLTGGGDPATGGGDPSGSPTPGGPGVSGGSTSPSGGCPVGTVLDFTGDICLLSGTGRNASAGVVVEPARSGDIIGGRVISLRLARRLYRSACLAGRGPSWVVVGNNRANRITVGGPRMRVLGLGGSDTITVRSGRGTCIDGGRGNDRLVNRGRNRVVVYGSGGNDRITIGNGPAAVDAGAGNNVITAGTGRDLIVVGAGRNIITARGAHVLVRAGRGRTVAHLRAANIPYARRHGVWRALVLRG